MSYSSHGNDRGWGHRGRGGGPYLEPVQQSGGESHQNWQHGGQFSAGGAAGYGQYSGYGNVRGAEFSSSQSYRAMDRHGGNRGQRGRGGRRDRRDTHGSEPPSSESMRTGQSGGLERERPPPGLKGREIGMWYAKRSQARKEKEQKQNRPTVSMDKAKENKIRQLLDNLQDTKPPAGQASSNTATSSLHSAHMAGVKSKSPHSREQGGSEEDLCQSAKKAVHGAVSTFSNSDTFDYNVPNTVFVLKTEKEEPPDNWIVRADEEEMEEIGSAFDVSVVPPVKSTSTPEETEESVDLDGYDEDGNPLPSVTGVVQYMRAHGDYPYVSEEPETDFVSSVPESTDPVLDQEMSAFMLKQQKNPQFVKMLDFRKKLPSYNMRETIVNAVNSGQVLVISGETGCGKTTQVPQFILDHYIERGVGSQCRIICTQPRRISAISVAERVAAERCDKVNDTGNSSVGYQIRLETKRPRKQGSILFCTTGIVLKFLEGDPCLQRATHVIIDEIHERDLQSDFLMIILKDLLPRRPDLKVILMSATLNAEMFSQYFNNCSMLNIPGYTFTVKEYLLEDIIEMTNYRPGLNTSFRRKPRQRPKPEEIEEDENYRVWLRSLVGRYDQRTIDVLADFDYSALDLVLIHHIIQHICTWMDDGAILVFVPGWEEIKKLNEMIQKTAESRSGSLRIIPLHSLMPTVNQREVFQRPPAGVRKIVIATNIAETSITIDDVVFVIDCGKIKVKDFKPETNLTSLESQWVSKANAKQRRGRAGRVQAGHCFHLYTEFRDSLFQDYLPPEMLRTRLEELCLQIKLLKLGRIVPFISKAMQHPSMEAITHAVDTLMELNALDGDENLLPLGYHLARMPVEPHTGKMILFGAMFCCLDPILTVAASLSFKDAFTIPLGKEELADQARRRLSAGSKSDHIMLINAFQGWETSSRSGNSNQYCWDNFLSENTLKMLKDMKRQLSELLFNTGFIASKDIKDSKSNIHSSNQSLIRAVLCAGLYPNVAQITKVPRPQSARFKGIGMVVKDQSRVAAHPKSVNVRGTFFESKWMVYYHMLKTSKIYIHDCTMVSPYPLLFFGGNIKILKEGETELVSVDDWVLFKASASTAQLVKDLRSQLDKLLTDKITHPGPTSWDSDSAEGALMAAISDLITTEDVGYYTDQNMGGSIGVPSSSS